MSPAKWWKDDAFTIGELENEDSYVTTLSGRQVEGVWEYAAVRWRHRQPTLLWTLKEGVLRVIE